MRLNIIILILNLSCQTPTHEKFNPTIVFLDPLKKTYDTVLITQIQSYDQITIWSEEDKNEYLKQFEKEPENIKKSKLAEGQFLLKIDFGATFNLMLYTMVTYMVFGETDKGLFLPTHDTASEDPEKLKIIARKHRVKWVINPLELSSYQKDGKIFSKARILIYNAEKNKIVSDEEYTGDSKNPGFELSCEDGSLDCTMNNIINMAVHDILITILGRYQH